MLLLRGVWRMPPGCCRRLLSERRFERSGDRAPPWVLALQGEWPRTAPQRLAAEIKRRREASRDPVTGEVTARIVEPTEEQAPGMRAQCAALLRHAGDEGVLRSQFWLRYRHLYAGYAQPTYMFAQPQSASRRILKLGDRAFNVSVNKPDRTLKSLLSAYGTPLSDFLLSIPNTKIIHGGRMGARVVLLQAQEGEETGEENPPPGP
jgi:hypothetical protein